MRIIPKKIKVKNTVWKCYSMTDVVVALFVFALIFIAVTAGNWAFAIIMGLIAVVMFMPTPDGIFYTCIFENVKFLFVKKRYTADAKNPKENINALIGLKEIKTNGLLAYSGRMYGRVIKVGQKNFGIEDVVQQNIDIGYIANALKILDANQSADIVKIDRPVNLDGFSEELFDRLSALREEESQTREIRQGILQERIDRIDKLNNIRKQYLSDYYIVVYGRNELDLESTAINIAGEVGKLGEGHAVHRPVDPSVDIDKHPIRDVLVGYPRAAERIVVTIALREIEVYAVVYRGGREDAEAEQLKVHGIYDIRKEVLGVLVADPGQHEAAIGIRVVLLCRQKPVGVEVKHGLCLT